MEGAASSIRGGMTSRRSRLFSGLLGGYPGISQGCRSILGQSEDEEEEESVEEQESEENEVVAALAGAPEASEALNLALSNQPLFSQDDGENDPINDTAHSRSSYQAQFKSPIIQDSIHEGT
ncbi:hypothetical protein O181_000069 [Austropuccinia psidii MF-1]|uniref:Uncharacterized protein n=1 Tax=Austropuccinia psidii MF-1 TaxID=1389203 RepID=A0A9Q3B7W0_9BASI|nr:hypothetical protein [Austropuccinia psidii MF-1]